MANDSDRRTILERRKRLVAAALAGAGLVVSTADCGGESGQGQGSTDAASDGTGGTAEPCLIAPWGGGGTPHPCLTGGTGGTPQPCLSGAGGMAGAPDAAPDVELDVSEDGASDAGDASG